jgi:hypothetical protein
MEFTILLIVLLFLGIMINPIIQYTQNGSLKNRSSKNLPIKEDIKVINKYSNKNFLNDKKVLSLIEKILDLNNLSHELIELVIPLNLNYQIQDGRNQRDIFRNDHKLAANKVMVLLSNCKYLFFDQDISNHLETIESNKYVIKYYALYDLSNIKEISIHSNKRDHEIDSIRLVFKEPIKIMFDKHTFKGEEENYHVLEKNEFYAEKVQDWHPGLFVDKTNQIIDKANKLLSKCK